MALDLKPIADLFQLGKYLHRRDEIVRIAHDFGVSKNQIYEVTGLARTTVDRILDETAAVEGPSS